MIKTLTIRLDQARIGKLDILLQQFDEKTYSKTILRLIDDCFLLGESVDQNEESFASVSEKYEKLVSSLRYIREVVDGD